MKKINRLLLDKLSKSLGVKKTRLYELIDEEVRNTHLDRPLAAIKLASRKGINISRFASSDDLATIRGAARNNPLPQESPNIIPARSVRTRSIEKVKIELGYIKSKYLRKILERDISELNTAIDSGIGSTSKTCLILCGSIVEAILLNQLSKKKHSALVIAKTQNPKISNNLEEWDLYEMVNVATQMKPPLLPDDSITGATQLRKWRNLIHPGREIKDFRIHRITPNKSRARSAIAFLQSIGEELNN